MAIILPFRGYRPRPDAAERVASPPYDVVSTEEARAIVSGNPLSFLRVGRAEVDLPPGTDIHSQAVYAKARENLDSLIASGALIRDEAPSLYVYRQEMADPVTGKPRAQTGLLSLVSVDEYRSGAIRRHELTRVDKEDDRARHIEATGSHSGPAFLAYRPVPAIRRILESIAAAPPSADFRADDGVGHSLWPVSDPARVRELVSLFGSDVGRLYIADGHHRSAAAARVRDALMSRNASHRGDEPYNYFLAVSFPADELRIMAYNRVVADIRGLSEKDFLERAGEKFQVRPLGTGEAPEPVEKREYGLRLGKRWLRLSAKPGSFPAEDPVRSLDVQVLQENLLGPVLGIGDPRTDGRIDFVGGIKGGAELVRRCDGGGAAIAFLCRPVEMDEIMAVADSDLIMPPKSTWFEPKLRDGIVIDLMR
jgi:uncharacterized protein (DUF1015 family)